MNLTIKTPAKINLFLEITEKRPDGYHNLESIMQTVGLCDELSFEPAEKDIALSVIGSGRNPGSPVIPEIHGRESAVNSIASLPTEQNIVFKAAKALKENFNVQKGIKITLKKNIPSGAGLGGGSSDAAATVNALVKLWGIKAEKSELNKIASKLGADVPFFLTGGTALCEGIGDIVSPLAGRSGELRVKSENKYAAAGGIENSAEQSDVAGSALRASNFKLNAVLVNPGFGVPTPSVYKKVKLPFTNTRKIDKIKNLIEKGSFNAESAKEVCFNRLEDFVFGDYPEIKKIKDILASLGCASLMSGSGATVFGIYDKPVEQKIKAGLEKHNWNFWFTETI
ncbi:MAG: hypothetical protein LBR69_05150 [Endomicrobium sp.]|jgi:4-diphosphocytidyl-2-C-methyl-D-erythritol kinase|nr:hypothetical protein [Endomicrobium sp.]